MIMETKMLGSSDADIAAAAELIKYGFVVGIPTETVYGLGADALNESAVRAVFAAKGRPADNPLIVHIADFSQAEKYAENIPELAYRLAERFCPGPITMVLPKKRIIPNITSGGLDTVGIRVPSHDVMHRIIAESGCPIAAPSANISGLPSPTSAEYVMNDMKGRIAAVLDGGASQFGVESTVISFEGEDAVRILRPGAVTREMLLEICGKVIVDPAVLKELEAGAEAASPGMKYKHYSPKANVIIAEGGLEAFRQFISRNNGEKVYSLIYDSESSGFEFNHMTYGDTAEQQAHLLFQRLRELDEAGAETVYVRPPSREGVGLAVYNRLIRAAGFEVIKV